MAGQEVHEICRKEYKMDLREQYKILDDKEPETEEQLEPIAALQKQIREIIDDPDSDEGSLTLLKDRLRELQIAAQEI